MLEIEKLEKEWRRYRLKRLKPLIFSSIALLVAAAAAVWLTETGSNSTLKNGAEEIEATALGLPAAATKTSSNIEPSVPVEKASVPIVEKPIKSGTKKASVQTETKETEKKEVRMSRTETVESEVTLNPDTAFMESLLDDMKDSSTAKEYRAVIPVKEEIVASSTTERKKSPVSKKSDDTEIENTEKADRSKGSGLQIQSTKTNNTLQLLIERFSRSNDPKLASYIAQSYYKKGNYKKAVKWSVTANSLDPSGEESWITFARAKVKLGKRDEAIKALRVYLNQYSSRKVRSYLRRLESKR